MEGQPGGGSRWEAQYAAGGQVGGGPAHLGADDEDGDEAGDDGGSRFPGPRVRLAASVALAHRTLPADRDGGQLSQR